MLNGCQNRSGLWRNFGSTVTRIGWQQRRLQQGKLFDLKEVIQVHNKAESEHDRLHYYRNCIVLALVNVLSDG